MMTDEIDADERNSFPFALYGGEVFDAGRDVERVG
jgi:hypothetical protein